MHIHRTAGFLLLTLSLISFSGCTKSSSEPEKQGPSLTDQFDKAAGITDPNARARAMMGVALDQHQAKDSAGRNESLDEAEAAARKVEESLARAGVYTQLARTYAKVDDLYKAGGALEKAVAAAEKVAAPEPKARALSDIAEVQGALLEDQSAARRSLEKAEGLIEKIDTPQGQISAAASIARAYHKVGLKEDAQRVANKALEDAEALEDVELRAEMLTVVAGAQVQSGAKADAQSTLRKAVAAVDNVERPYTQVYRLKDVILQYLKAGNHEEAQKLYDRAKEISETIPAPDQMNDARRLLGELKRKL